MDHVGVVVDDLAAATAFFVALGLEVLSEWSADGGVVYGIVGLEGVRTDNAMLATPDGSGRLELSKFHTPPARDGDAHAPVNTPGLRHLTFAVDDLDAAVTRAREHAGALVGAIERYGDTYRLCCRRPDRAGT
jgi:catechol 2,3-dioxygenase-like lactoylglutathione lyase family enzyme